MLAAVGLHALVNAVINLPVLPERVVAASFIPAINSGVADQIGWPAYVAQVDAVVDRARAADPAVAVLASNYGEAGAVDRFTRHLDVPLVSGHNALWDAGGPPPRTRTVVVVRAQAEDLTGVFHRCETAAELRSGVPTDNEEEGEPVAICTGPRQDWATLWPSLRHLD